MKNCIAISNRQNRLPLTDNIKQHIKLAVCETLKYEGIDFPCDVSVSIVSKDEIRTLNSSHRKIDKETDVLSFPMYERVDSTFVPNGRTLLGDIVICAEVAAKQARELEHSVPEEIAFLCIHSTLHLLGYDHVKSVEDEEDMCTRQKEIKERMGIK
ncbi:MAG: rRNA maturation RNase YbeY [Clostridia bacterium]|nr:rRNA maturation RNase YbeY [Clostridia bacterium]